MQISLEDRLNLYKEMYRFYERHTNPAMPYNQYNHVSMCGLLKNITQRLVQLKDLPELLLQAPSTIRDKCIQDNVDITGVYWWHCDALGTEKRMRALLNAIELCHTKI